MGESVPRNTRTRMCSKARDSQRRRDRYADDGRE